MTSRTTPVAALALAAILTVACKNDGPSGKPAGNTPIDTDADTDAGEPSELDVPCGDLVADVYGDPGDLPQALGEIVKCAVDDPVSLDDLQAAADAEGYAGDPFVSGARVYKVLYRTQRGNDAPGTSSAVLYVPDAPRADALPALVASHGSRGQGPLCAPSLNDASAAYVHPDFIRQVYPLVGAGFAVMAPDLAGYADYGAPGNPPSAYGHTEDVGRSTLDGIRAMRHLVGSMLGDAVALVGHSQGGQTALAALAIHETYGPEGDIDAVALYAPLWVSQRSWGAIMAVAAEFPFSESAAGAVSIWYHYTHSELLDGPGRGTDVFAAGVHDSIRAFVDTDCWAESYPRLEALGDTVLDVYASDYANAIQFPAAFGWDCAGNAMCETWIARFLADRPHLTGAAAQVPILLAYGMADDTIDVGRMSCVVERFQEDALNVEMCIDNDAGHGEILDVKAQHVVRWLAARTLGEPDPGACGVAEEALVDPKGQLIVPCTTPPPND